MKNKIKRTATSVLSVSKTRTGECKGCGACCRLPNPCTFLKYDKDGRSFCSIYIFRPLNCRKYPRTESEWLTSGTCGFRFEPSPEAVHPQLPVYRRLPSLLSRSLPLITLASWPHIGLAFKHLKKFIF